MTLLLLQVNEMAGQTSKRCAHGVDSTAQAYTHLLKTFPSVALRMSPKRLKPRE